MHLKQRLRTPFLVCLFENIERGCSSSHPAHRRIVQTVLVTVVCVVILVVDVVVAVITTEDSTHIRHLLVPRAPCHCRVENASIAFCCWQEEQPRVKAAI
jgi:hypothetical protein